MLIPGGKLSRPRGPSGAGSAVGSALVDGLEPPQPAARPAQANAREVERYSRRFTVFTSRSTEAARSRSPAPVLEARVAEFCVGPICVRRSSHHRWQPVGAVRRVAQQVGLPSLCAAACAREGATHRAVGRVAQQLAAGRWRWRGCRRRFVHRAQRCGFRCWRGRSAGSRTRGSPDRRKRCQPERRQCGHQKGERCGAMQDGHAVF